MVLPCNFFIFMLHLMITCTILCPSHVEGVLHQLQYPSRSNVSVNFLAIGDWGRKGAFNQSLIARQMGVIAERLGTQFVISTGDNFYKDGLKNADDPLFQESFTKIYTAKSLQTPWYSILGNHDYHGNTQAQLSPILKKRDRRWHCMRSYIVKGGLLNIIFVDTSPFINKYFRIRGTRQRFNWTGVMPRVQYLSRLLKDLKLALNNSRTMWTIVVGHHPIRSIGHNGDTLELVKQILPLLETYKVDMYINGHDHSLQRLSGPKSRIQFLTTGGGSRAWKGDIHYEKHKDSLKFYYDGQGFMSAQITHQVAKIAFYDVHGSTLHSFKMFPRRRME